MRALAAAVLLLAAGCAASPAPGAGPCTVDCAGPIYKEGTGWLDVVVVDEAIRPVANATVTVASAVGGQTNVDGVLRFTDVVPGSYIVGAAKATYLPKQETVAVVAGETATLRLILAADIRPLPYHTTYPLDGYMEAWGGLAQFAVEEASGGTPLCTCRIVMQPDPDLYAVVFEAFWEPSVPDPGAVGNFYWFVRQTDGQGLQQGDYCFSPCQVAVGTGTYVQGAELEARLDGPDVWPAARQSFQLFVTLWYHAPPPAGWSIEDEQP